MTVFDSNTVLRYILQDNEEMADTVETKITREDCFIPFEVISEMVFVLSKVYQIPRRDISEVIIDILKLETVQTVNYAVAEKGLTAYAGTKLDFVDCLMIGYQCNGYPVFTFDKDLKKHLRQQEML